MTGEKLEKVKFGTSGLRGLATALLAGAAETYCASFARLMLAERLIAAGGAVYLGRDRRLSSPDIMRACMAGLAAEGLRAIDCDLAPTPALALHAMTNETPAVMVTGSHIPADRNGIKFYRPDGEITKDDERRIAEGVREHRASSHGLPPAGSPATADAITPFFDRYASLFEADAFSGLRIGVYDHSSVATDLIARLLERFGADIARLGRAKGFVPVDTEAVDAQTRAALEAWAAAHRLHAIVSTDADGDRPLVADETGAPLRGDFLGLLAARLAGADAIVTPVTSNSGIRERAGITIRRTRVGSPFVIDGMAQSVRDGARAVVGFEANGGVLLATPVSIAGIRLEALPTRDSVLPILAVLAEAKQTRLPLSRLEERWEMPVCRADRIVDFAPERSAALLEWLRAAPANMGLFLDGLPPVAEVDDTDGLRMTLADGSVIHLRASGNAPEMRCYVEAADAASADRLLRDGLAAIRRTPEQGEVAS